MVAIATLIVDDEPDIRLLIRATIEAANRGLRVVAEAANGEDAIEQCRLLRPDIVVLDNRMPGLSGLEAAERILAERPGQSIVLFSAYLDADVERTSSRLGIRACVSKRDFDTLPETLLRLSA